MSCDRLIDHTGWLFARSFYYVVCKFRFGAGMILIRTDKSLASDFTERSCCLCGRSSCVGWSVALARRRHEDRGEDDEDAPCEAPMLLCSSTGSGGRAPKGQLRGRPPVTRRSDGGSVGVGEQHSPHARWTNGRIRLQPLRVRPPRRG